MTKMIINMGACVTRLQVGHVHASHMPGILCFQKPIACVIIERFNRIKSHSPGFNLCRCQSNGLRPLVCSYRSWYSKSSSISVRGSLYTCVCANRTGIVVPVHARFVVRLVRCWFVQLVARISPDVRP